MLYIVLAYLMLFAALTNSVCLNNASFFFLFKYFLCQGYELSGEIALKNNHYYYFYYVLKRDLNDDSDGAHLTSFGIEFQTEEEAKENERSPSVALLCAGLLRRGMVYELERVLQVCNGFLCSM